MVSRWSAWSSYTLSLSAKCMFMLCMNVCMSVHRKIKLTSAVWIIFRRSKNFLLKKAETSLASIETKWCCEYKSVHVYVLFCMNACMCVFKTWRESKFACLHCVFFYTYRHLLRESERGRCALKLNMWLYTLIYTCVYVCVCMNSCMYIYIYISS